MSNKPFQFKEFTIKQDQTAMKIGTDGVLLGAWAHIKKDVSSILDIGTGTGLIALQLAQKSDCEVIDAVEIDSDAYEQAVDNFENSPWANRLFCYHASIQEFVDEMDDSYDLIISNPPYFNSTYKKLEAKRAKARHTASLSFDELLSATTKLLTINGSCAFIIPSNEENEFIALSKKYNLYPQKITRVKGNLNSDFKRSLLQLSKIQIKPEIDTLVIEIERHVYTESYLSLVKEFYLKL